MTLREILKDCHLLDNEADVQIRTYGPNNEDLLAGYGVWKNGKLIDDEGNHYNLDFEVLDYEFEYSPLHYNEVLLTLWYESEWFEG